MLGFRSFLQSVDVLAVFHLLEADVAAEHLLVVGDHQHHGLVGELDPIQMSHFAGKHRCDGAEHQSRTSGNNNVLVHSSLQGLLNRSTIDLDKYYIPL